MDLDGFEWIYRYMDIWIYGYMDIWIYGHMDMWIYGLCVYTSVEVLAPMARYASRITSDDGKERRKEEERKEWG